MIITQPNNLKTVYGVVFALLAILVVVNGAAAKQMVVLATGEVMTVDRAQVRDGRVWITWNGLSLSIAEKDVLRIESDGKNHTIVQDKSPPSQPEPSSPETRKPTTGKIASKRKHHTKSAPVKRSAPEKAAAETDKDTDSSEPVELSATAEELLTFLEFDGFGDIKWGAHREAQIGLKRLYKNSELPEVIEYVRPTDSLQLGSDAEPATIKYAFWKDRLYMVTLWAPGPEAFESIRQAMVNKFGQGIPKPDNPQTLYWIDEDADRMIEYLEDKGLSLLWMRSREINNQYKLAQLRFPIRAGQGVSAVNVK